MHANILIASSLELAGHGVGGVHRREVKKMNRMRRLPKVRTVRGKRRQNPPITLATHHLKFLYNVRLTNVQWPAQPIACSPRRRDPPASKKISALLKRVMQ